MLDSAEMSLMFLSDKIHIDSSYAKYMYAIHPINAKRIIGIFGIVSLQHLPCKPYSPKVKPVYKTHPYSCLMLHVLMTFHSVNEGYKQIALGYFSKSR